MTASVSVAKARRTSPAVGLLGCAAGLAACWFGSEGLEPSLRLTVMIYAAALLAWCLAIVDEWITGVAAVVSLLALGLVDIGNVAASATHDLVWLLVAAYLIAFAIRKAGLLDWLAAAAMRRPMRLSSLFYRSTAVIAVTAFVVPATSARAAILLPVYRMLSAACGDPRADRALALLFPSIILLSAGGVLTGAGAHVVALEVMQASGRDSVGYWTWLLLALPIAIASSYAATWLILRLFLDRETSGRQIAVAPAAGQRLSRQQSIMLIVLAATVALWMTNEWHRAGLATAGLVSAALLLLLARQTAPIPGVELLKAVDWKLLIFLVSTIVLADALITSGAASAFARLVATALPAGLLASPAAMVALIAALSMLAHLAIPSRSARAAILIPAIALPLSAARFDIAVVALLIALGTGFCQLSVYGAKPLMIFGSGCGQAFSGRDLVRLGVPLMVICWGILTGAVLLVWPALGFSVMAGGNGDGGPAFIP